jgi:hypothetical protein
MRPVAGSGPIPVAERLADPLDVLESFITYDWVLTTMLSSLLRPLWLAYVFCIYARLLGGDHGRG